MLKQLKIHLEDTKIWVTGCTHVFHNQPFIWQKRGYNSIEDHANDIIRVINENVKENDVLIHLGDGFLNSTPEQVREWWAGINCKKIFYVWGNHEASTKKIYKEEIFKKYNNENIEVYPFVICDKVELLGNYVEAYINKQAVCFSHFPFAIWNSSHHGSFACHSHNHGSFKESLPDYPNLKRLDCGWDVFKRPINFKEIKEIMDKKQIQILDHHDNNTN